MTGVTTFSKTEIYEALYALNAGIQQFLNAIAVLEKSELGFALLDANRLLAEELRAGVNHSVVSVMEQIESRDWGASEKERLGRAAGETHPPCE